MTMIKERMVALVMATLLGLMAGYANAENFPVHPQDPYENFNRKVFNFNMVLDRNLFRPIAKIYAKVIPWPLKRGVSNFFSNLEGITIIVNELLQMNFSQATAELARLMINTTVGIGGVFDIASSIGLERDTEDFGLTLGVWGSRESPYLVIPFFGSYILRDAVGASVDYLLFSPWVFIKSNTLCNSLIAGNTLQRRSILLVGDEVVDQSFDPYAFIRDAYLQRRSHLVRESKKQQIEHYEDNHGVMRRVRRSVPAHSVISD